MSNRPEDKLKECYTLASLTCPEGQVKDVLNRKLRQLNTKGSEKSRSVPVMASEILSDALFELAESNTEANKRTQSVCYGRVRDLPQSSERDYILALYALQEGVSNENVLVVIDHLNAALTSSEKANWDPRYRALGDMIREMKGQ